MSRIALLIRLHHLSHLAALQATPCQASPAYAICPTALLLFIPEYFITWLHLADCAGLVRPQRSNNAEPEPRDPSVFSEGRKLQFSAGRTTWLLLPGLPSCLAGSTCWYQPRARVSGTSSVTSGTSD